MAGPSSTSSTHPHVSSHDNQAADLKAFFAHGFEIQTADPDLLDKWVTHRFNICAATNVEDYELWVCIRMDFKKFEAKHFDMLDSNTWRHIREYCYLHGLWIDVNNGSETFTTAMLEAIAADWYDEWTLEQIKWVEKRYHALSTVTSQRKQELTGIPYLDSASNPETNIQDTGFQTPLQQSATLQPMYPVMTKRSPYVYQPHQNHQPHQPHQPQQPPKQPVPLQLPQQTPYLPHPQSSYKASQPPNEPQLNQPQAAELQKQTGVRNQYSKELIMLDKIYKDDDKFSGTGDNFSFKVTIFLDKCRRVGLPEDAYIQGASIMLSGQAQTYYYANRGNNSTFDQFCSNMQSFFEGPEWQRFNLTKWQTISLNDIISAKPTLSMCVNCDIS